MKKIRLDSAALAELDRIKKANGFTLTPHPVIEAARAPDSALHRFIEWDDRRAAQIHRLHQASRLIHAYVRIRVPANTAPTPIRATVKYQENELPIVAATVQSKDASDIERFRQDMRSIEVRYSHHPVIAPVVAAMLRVLNKLLLKEHTAQHEREVA